MALSISFWFTKYTTKTATCLSFAAIPSPSIRRTKRLELMTILKTSKKIKQVINSRISESAKSDVRLKI